MKKNIRNDYCIRMFVGSDNDHPAMMKVHFENGFLYATNAQIAVKADCNIFMHKYESVDKYPDVEKIIKNHVVYENKIISTNSLFNDLMKVECCFKPKLIDCDDCNGEGVKTCEYCDCESECEYCDCESECDKCDGEGKTNGTELELTSEYQCKLFNKYYRLSNLDVVIKTAIILNIDKIEIHNSEGYAGNIFKIGDFTILVMPMLNPDN